MGALGTAGMGMLAGLSVDVAFAEDAKDGELKAADTMSAQADVEISPIVDNWGMTTEGAAPAGGHRPDRLDRYPAAHRRPGRLHHAA